MKWGITAVMMRYGSWKRGSDHRCIADDSEELERVTLPVALLGYAATTALMNIPRHGFADHLLVFPATGHYFLIYGDLNCSPVLHMGKVRREAFELYSQMGKTRAALNVAQIRQPEVWDIFLTASTNDSIGAEGLYYLLGSSYKVFHAPKEIAPGESWREIIAESLEHSRAMVVLFSKERVQRVQTLLLSPGNIARTIQR